MTLFEVVLFCLLINIICTSAGIAIVLGALREDERAAALRDEFLDNFEHQLNPKEAICDEARPDRAESQPREERVMTEHLAEIPCLICGTPLSAYVEEHSFVPALVVDDGDVVLDWTRTILDDYEVLNYYCPECYTEYTISEMKEVLDAMQKEDEDA